MSQVADGHGMPWTPGRTRGKRVGARQEGL